MKKIVLFVVAAMFVSCASATLTKKGMEVKYVTKEEAPANCKKVNEVFMIGNEFGADVNEIQIILRNKVAEMGGNFLVIDVIEKHQPGDGRLWYTGNGRAYKCSQ